MFRSRQRASTPLQLETLEDRQLLTVGNLDLLFGNSGLVVTNLGGAAQLNDVAVTSDQNDTTSDPFLAVGQVDNGANGLDVVVSRFLADGTLDNGFGNAGSLTFDFNGGDDAAVAVAQQTIANIPHLVIAGFTTNSNGDQDLLLMRIDLNTGLNDLQFNGGQPIRIDLGGNEVATDIAIDADGITIVGTTESAGTRQMVVARFDNFGQPEAGFGDNGIVILNPGVNAEANAIVRQADGKFVIGGSANDDFALIRLNLDGSLDNTFGSNGVSLTNFTGSRDIINSLVIQETGNIVAAGVAGQGRFDFVALARYDTNGQLDATFGAGSNTQGPAGTVTTAVDAFSDIGRALVQQPNGRLVVAGRARVDEFNPDNENFALVRYTSEGILDDDFGIAGRVITNFPTGSTGAFGLSATDNGQLIAVGTAQSGEAAIARYQADIRPITTDDTLAQGVSENLNTLFFNVVATDFDPDGDDIRVTQLITNNNVIIPPNQQQFVAGAGTVSTDGMNVFFTPINGFSGTFTLDYVITDEWLTDRGTVSFSVTPDQTNPGSPDLSLSGAENVVVTSFSTNNDQANAQAIQADGKIVTVGFTQTGNNTLDIAVVRYNPDGSLDEAFGNNGRMTVDFAGFNDEALDVLIQNDGSILVAGYTTDANGSDFTLIRLTADGFLDRIFGNFGFARVDFAGLNDFAFSLIEQGGGFLLGGLTTTATGDSDFALARFDANGIIDTTFDGDGRQTTEFNLGRNNAIRDLTLDSAGRILAGGFANSLITGNDFAVARYNADGSFDTSFTQDFASGDDLATGIVFDAVNNEITLGGFATNASGDRDFALAQFDQTGALTNDFGINGLVTTDFSGMLDEGRSLIIDGNGNFVLAGVVSTDVSSINSLPQDFGIARYTSAGGLDATFGNGGLAFQNFSGENDQAMSVLQDANNNYLLAGVAGTFNNGNAFALVRFQEDGNKDAGFGENVDGALFQIVTNSGIGEATAVLELADGSIILGGTVESGIFPNFCRTSFVLNRLDADGNLDTSFGTNGIVTINFNGTNEARLFDLALINNKIVAVGSALNNVSGGDLDFAIARLELDGTLDQSFDGDGMQLIDFNQGDDTAFAVFAQGTDIILAGSAERFMSSETDFALTRLLADGSIDTSFGSGGRTTTQVSLTESSVIKDLGLLSTGEIVATGFAVNSGQSDIALAKYSVNGVLDNTFGTNGIIVTDFQALDDEGRGITVLSDDSILVTGFVTNPNSSNTQDVFVLKVNSNGVLDNTFGTGGLTISAANVDFVANDITVDSQDRIIVVGSAFLGGIVNNVFTAARFNADGTADTTFGANGRIAVSFDNGDGGLNAVTIDSEGKILAAGRFDPPDANVDSQFALIRFESEFSGNILPLARDDIATTAVNQPVNVFLIANDQDLNEDLLTITNFTQPANGVVIDEFQDGSLTYIPDNGFIGTDTFQYTITDGTDFTTANVTITVINGPANVADLLDPDRDLVTDTRFLSLSAENAAGEFTFPLTTFQNPNQPTLLLTTGSTNTAVNNTTAGVDNKQAAPVERGLANDVIVLEVDLDVPVGHNYLSFDFLFATNEFPLFSQLNLGFADAFVAELDNTSWFVDPSTSQIIAPDNFAFDFFDPNQAAISTESGFFNEQVVVTQTGTLYNGSTPVLNAGTPITPGRHTLYLSIFDVSDGQVDSGVFIRNLRTSIVDAPANGPGAVPFPDVKDDWAPFVEGQPVNIPVLANDLVNPGSVRIVNVTQPDFGNVVIAQDGQSVIYTPPPSGNAGENAFTYTVSDGRGLTSTATVILMPLVVETNSSSTTPSGANVEAQAGIATGTLDNNTPGSGSAFLTVSQFADNPVNVLFGNDSTFFDILTPESNATNQVTLVVQDPGGSGQLFYFTGATFELVRNSGNTDPIRLPDGNLLVILDDTSQPRITGLIGTVFTIPVSTPATPATPVTPPTAGLGNAPSVNLGALNNVQLSIGLTSNDSNQVRVSESTEAARSERTSIDLSLAAFGTDSSSESDRRRRTGGTDEEGISDLDLLWMWEMTEEGKAMLQDYDAEDEPPKPEELNPADLIPPPVEETKEANTSTEEATEEEVIEEEHKESTQVIEMPELPVEQKEETTVVSSHLAWAAFLTGIGAHTQLRIKRKSPMKVS